MKAIYLIGAVLALVLMMSTAFAYSGFNRYYYTNNYVSDVYYPSPAYTVYSYPSYYTTSYYTPTYYPTYYAPAYAYVAPVTYGYNYPYYGYAYSRTDMAHKNTSVFTAGYQAVGDWLGKRQNSRYLPPVDVTEEIAEEVQV